MRAYDIIDKKKKGLELTKEEIEFLINGFVSEEIPDYQMSAFLMAICLNGMNDKETTILTQAITASGDVADLSIIDGIKVDKHSTGGVGDKTTLIVAPIVAACGVKVAKMSGRGLGHTGGTIDKLESIPGFKVELSKEDFERNVKEIGVSVIAQSGNIAPADKKLYALRDVTATVDSIPLIASSIMGKKLASGSDCILLDVKTGSGAFMKTKEDSVYLAKVMVAIGELSGKRTAALITNMDIPLGKNIGNSLEIIEALEILKGDGPDDLRNVSYNLAANMLYLAKKGTIEECMKMVEDTVNSKKALDSFRAFVKAQGGNEKIVDDVSLLPTAKYEYKVLSKEDGYVYSIDTEGCGIASVMLGAGREYKGQDINYGAGIRLEKKTGDTIKKGDIIAIMYADDESLFASANDKILASYKTSDKKPEVEPDIIARVTADNVEYYGG